MKKEQLSNLQDKAERNSIKNEYSKAVLSSIQEIFNGIAECANDKNGKQSWTVFEVKRVEKRTESLFNLLFELMSESNNTNEEMITQLAELRHLEE